jgi:hypothetical protein
MVNPEWVKDTYSSADDYRYNFTYLAKIRTTFAILLVFVLLSSVYSIASHRSGVWINTVLAKKSSSKDGGGGDGGGSSDTSSNNDKGTSSENGGGDSSSTDNTDNNPSPSPPPVSTDNTGTGGTEGTTGQQQQPPAAQQQEQQQQQCPTGQHFDVNQNACVNDTTLAPPSQGLARGDLPPSALETSNNPPVSSFCAGQTHYNSDTGKCDDNKQQLPSGGCVEGYTLGNDGLCHNAAAEAAAAAAGAIDIPPDGKCPPGYHMVKTPGSQKNVCFPNPPIDKSSPEAAVLPQTTPPSPSPAAKAAEAATAAAAGAISIPPDGKCPPGYHLQDNWCYPDPITKNSPEAAIRQGIGGSTNTLAPSTPPNQFGAGNVGSLPPSALETNANCPAGSHSDVPTGTCFPNSQPLSAGGCIPGWHLVSDTHCEKDFAKIDTIPPNTTGDLPLEVGPSKFGQDTQNSIPPASTNPPVTPPANPASQPECVPGFHWDNSQQQCVADTKSDPNNPDSSRQDLLDKLARSPGDPIISSPGDPVKPDRYPPDPIGPNTLGQNNIPPNPIGPK